jgi:GT2 family glycosyltransferase
VKKTTLKTVSVIVPVYQGGQEFRECLDSLARCSPPPHEIIIVADGENGSTYSFVAEAGHELLVLESNSGPSVARNFGAENATGDILLFIDSDVVVQQNLIKKVLTGFESDSTVSAIIGSYDDRPAKPNFLSQYRNLLHHFVHQHAEESASTFWGACGAVKRDVFQALGGFSSCFRKPSIEDIEFGYLLKKSGYMIRLDKDLQITHLKQWSFRSILYTDILRRAFPWSRLILAEKTLPNDLNVSIKARLCIIMAFLLIFCMLSVCINRNALWGVTPIISLLLYLNKDFYLFLHKARGFLFMLASLPLHWLYFFYSGLALSAAIVTHYTSVVFQKNQRTRCHK